MGLRETLNENPGITTAGTALIILAALVFVGISFMRGGGAGGAPSNQTWFSDDDGKTWFADDRTKIAPFDHNGKQAVRAYVYTCDGGKTKFVGWLERYTPAAKKQLEDVRAQSGGVMPLEVEARTGVQVKKPGTGEKGWVSQSDPRAVEILEVKCPDGTIDNLDIVPDP